MNYLRMFTPMFLHYGINVCLAALLSGKADATTITSAVALVTIPLAVWLIKLDQEAGRVRKEQCMLHGCRSVIVAIMCVLAGGLLNYLYSSLLIFLRIQEAFSNEVQETLLRSSALIQIMGLGILVPVAEELIFRGLMYKRIRAIFPAGGAIFISALLFALYHGNPIQMIYVFPMAMVLGGLYEWSKSLVYPILFHAGANLLAVGLNIFM